MTAANIIRLSDRELLKGLVRGVLRDSSLSHDAKLWEMGNVLDAAYRPVMGSGPEAVKCPPDSFIDDAIQLYNELFLGYLDTIDSDIGTTVLRNMADVDYLVQRAKAFDEGFSGTKWLVRAYSLFYSTLAALGRGGSVLERENAGEEAKAYFLTSTGDYEGAAALFMEMAGKSDGRRQDYFAALATLCNRIYIALFNPLCQSDAADRTMLTLKKRYLTEMGRYNFSGAEMAVAAHICDFARANIKQGQNETIHNH